MSENYVDVRKTRVAEYFNTKCQLMGIDMETQVRNLNKIYEGKLKFKVGAKIYNGKDSVLLDWVNPNIRILELPEVDNFEIGYVNSYSGMGYEPNRVRTLKIPKSMESLSWSDLSQFHSLTSLWIWDTTEMIGERHSFSSVKMVVIQSLNGAKPKVYRF